MHSDWLLKNDWCAGSFVILISYLKIYYLKGSSVRSLYEKGQGFPCFVSVEQDSTATAHEIALALSKVIGATKAGAIESSVREETAMCAILELLK